MENYRLLITDLTEYGDLRCVAGWDLDRKVMIRPEPLPGGFWPNGQTGANQAFAPGNIVRLSAAPPIPPTLLPHLNEDRVVAGTVHLVNRLSVKDFAEALAQIPVGPANKAFDPPLVFANGKGYIPTNTNYPSLQAFRIKANAIHFFEESYGDKQKPRCRISTGGRTANLSIAAADIRETYRTKGIREVARQFAGTDELHVRLGLARGFGNFPNRCYMQVNGIYKA